jgi:hypothetical protein
MSNIQALTNQNNSIYNALISKNVIFERSEISADLTDEEKLVILLKENMELKELSKNNRPPPQIKEKKVETQNTDQKKNNEQKDDDKEETYEDPVKKFSTILNLEDIKRAFFNKEYDTFETLIKEHPLKYYRASYNYASDKDDAPEFIAKNLVKGFVRNLDDFRKYFITGFRCFLNTDNESGSKTYTYPSLWIVNSNDNLQDIIGSLYEDFTFIEDTDLSIFLQDFRKIDLENNYNNNLIDEAYLH